MFKTFEDMCKYYIGCEGCPYYNCLSETECRLSYTQDKNKAITKLDVLVELEEIKQDLRKLIKHLGIK